MAGLLVLGTVTPAPFVAVGRGPTYDTLGEVAGAEVVAIDELPTYPTSGQLNMTTVGVTDGLTMQQALAMWASGDFQVVPRHTLFPPGVSGAEVTERNRAMFVDSQTNAEGAALAHLGMPVRVVVEGLTPDSPVAGILEPGDELKAVAGRTLTTYDDLTAALADTRPGQRIPLTFRHGDGGPRQVTVTLGARSDGAPQGALGLLPGARPLEEDRIVISLQDIGGPSAGLMFALATVDKLTPGQLTGGRFVAGTGTIHSTGTVGEINGIPFKMRAAREAGATVFLVPAGNCAQAAEAAPVGLQLIRVATLDDAVTGLDALRAGRTPVGC
jgi:Lon-like protease